MGKENVEFRYYEIPSDLPLLALQGEEWIRFYGDDNMHFHNCLEIGYCYYGQGILYFGKREEAYGPGTITIIPQNFPHHTRQVNEGPNRWEYLFVDVSRFLKMSLPDDRRHADFLKERLNRRMFLIPRGRDLELELLMKLILEEMRWKKKMYKPCVQALLQPFLIHAVRYGEDCAQGEDDISEEMEYGVILKALAYIDGHYMEELTMQELAGMFHMSPANFRRKFHNCMHVAPVRYVMLVRAEKACELLATTEESVEGIARKVGYRASETFIRNFKKMTGYSPLQWRKMAEKREDNLLQYNISVLKGY